jgi:sRNA-binding regulator protein Hfq
MTQEPSSFDDELGKLADRARRAEATRARRQRSDRSVAAALSGTFAGTLTEVGESQTPVAILTRNGGHLRGTVASLGPDVVVVQPAAANARVLVHLDAIEGVRSAGKGHDRETPSIQSGSGLAELLDEFAESRDRLAVTLASGNRVMGIVQRVGVDQLVLLLDGEADSMTVPIHKIDQVVMAS